MLETVREDVQVSDEGDTKNEEDDLEESLKAEDDLAETIEEEDELEEKMVEGIDIHPPPDQCLTAIVHRFHF